MADLYFEGFPNMNFPFINHQVTPFIRVYIDGGEMEKAKEKLDVLTDQLVEHMEFYNSLDPQVLRNSFQQDYRLAQRTLREVTRMAQAIGADYGEQVQSKLQPFNVQN